MSVAELSPADLPAPARPEAGADDSAPPVWNAVPELAIVIPTLNERDNVPVVVERLNRVLAGISWEVIFVDDDSPDGTAETVREVARRDPRIRCIQRSCLGCPMPTHTTCAPLPSICAIARCSSAGVSSRKGGDQPPAMTRPGKRSCRRLASSSSACGVRPP